MSLNLINLDEDTRKVMLDEINADISYNKLYLSHRLSLAGQKDYPILLKQAAEKYNDSWLATELRMYSRLNPTEKRNTRKGIVIAKTPVTATDTLAEGEINRFYLRGLCVRAIQAGVPSLTIYRAKSVDNPRHESELKIGTAVDAIALLADLRLNIGVDTAIGLPPGPNSGLSAKLSEIQFAEMI